MTFIYLETKRLILRDHVIEDLTTHHQLLSDEEVMYYLEDLKTTTLDESKKNLEEAIQQNNHPSRDSYFLRMIEKETNEPIGEIGFHVVSKHEIGKHVH